MKSRIYPHSYDIEDGDKIEMSKVFARNLFNKLVMATDGTEIGTLNNVVVEIKGGNVIDLMIVPNPNFDTSRYRKVDSYIFMPFDSVSAIKDYIIVDKMKAKVN